MAKMRSCRQWDVRCALIKWKLLFTQLSKLREMWNESIQVGGMDRGFDGMY